MNIGEFLGRALDDAEKPGGSGCDQVFRDLVEAVSWEIFSRYGAKPLEARTKTQEIVADIRGRVETVLAAEKMDQLDPNDDGMAFSDYLEFEAGILRSGLAWVRFGVTPPAEYLKDHQFEWDKKNRRWKHQAPYSSDALNDLQNLLANLMM
jgi:hypothetical protein